MQACCASSQQVLICTEFLSIFGCCFSLRAFLTLSLTLPCSSFNSICCRPSLGPPRRNYARSRKGTRAPIYEVGPRSRFVTVQMAVSPDDGIISYRVIPRTTTTENVTSFLAEAALSSLQLHPNSPVVFAMDNLSSHNQASLVSDFLRHAWDASSRWKTFCLFLANVVQCNVQ